MKTNQVFLLAFCLFASIFTYYILKDIIYTILMLIFTVIVSFKIIKKADDNKKKYNQLDNIYKLTSLLNLQMYSAKNLNEGYLGIMPYLNYEYQNIVPNELADYILESANESSFNSFRLYAKAIKIYENEGGDFNKLTKLPYQYISDCKNYYTKLKKEKILKLFDICLLYCLWILVICFLKFTISDYFNLMIKQEIYKALLFLILFFGFSSFQSCLLDFYKNKIRGL